MSKYLLPFERCWVLRSPSKADPKKVHFWVVANQWNSSPVEATIFMSEQAAQRQINDARHYKRAGFGADCIVEAVPLEGAVKTLGIDVTDEVMRRCGRRQ